MRISYAGRALPDWMRRALIAAPVLWCGMLVGAGTARAAALSVTKVGDTNDGACDADCSLREAITFANTQNGASTISFAISGAGVKTIVPATALPVLVRPITIDGYTQPDARANTLAGGSDAQVLVELAGTAATDGTRAGFDGLTVGVGGCVIRGLAINRFQNGIAYGAMTAAAGSIEGNFIGLDASGTIARGNVVGVAVSSGGTLTIGGTTAGARNVISGNVSAGVGFSVGGTSAGSVLGNFIGTNPAGTGAIGNGNGVAILSTSNVTIGGAAAGAGNLIAGNAGTVATNTGFGIVINGAGATGNKVLGNFIGVDVSGNLALGNSTNGVFIAAGNGNVIGGAGAGEGNVISGTTGGSGIRLVGASSNTIKGNFIGTNAAGTMARGNRNNGVTLQSGSANNLIGGTGADDGNLISGNNFGVDIGDATTTGNTVQGNLIGTNAAGTSAIGNTSNGVTIGGGAANNLIGGTAVGARNVISGNDFGIGMVGALNNTVQGNYIGVDITGAARLSNVQVGIQIRTGSNNNLIGGTAAGAGNVISGNGISGLDIRDNCTGNTIQGNLIGTNAAGTSALGNGSVARINTSSGVSLQLGASGNLIGGTAEGADNVISGNIGFGLGIVFPSTGNTIQGNAIGTRADGVTALPNNNVNVGIQGASGNTIGGAAAGAGNVIAFSPGPGIALVPAGPIPPNNTFAIPTGNSILSNSIFSNASLGIALSIGAGNSVTVTPNDAGDADGGANNRQNYPVLSGAVNLSGATTISGSLNSTPNSTFTVQFFSSPQPDPSGFGEGQTFLGETNVTTNGVGDAAFSFVADISAPTGQAVSATATNTSTGDTSEFSASILAGPSGSLQFSASTYSISEAGPSATITVTRTGGSAGTVSVSYGTSDRTATQGQDYASTSGTLTFLNGETTKTFTIPITDDALDEADETLLLALSAPTTGTGGAAIGPPSTAVLSIIDNDATPSLSVGSPRIAEGNAGSAPLAFVVTLSSASGQSVSVNFATSNGTATEGSDYERRSGTLTFAPGETSKTISVLILGDTRNEADETLMLTLSDASNATLSPSTSVGVGTTANDDGVPSLSISNVAALEGSSGTTNAIFTVTLSAASGTPVSTAYSTSNGTAIAPGDYTATSGTLTFAPGETSKSIAVAVNGDAVAEGDETFAVTLASPANATLAKAVGTGTITNDDARALTLSIAPSTLSEAAGAQAAVGTITRNTQDLSQPLTVTLASSSTSAATVPASVTIPSGAATVTFQVSAVDNAVVDGTRSVTISASATGFASATQVLAVTDNESPQLSLSISPASIAEGASATGTVTRNTSTTGALSVSLLSSDATEATVPATVVIPAGAASATFTVTSVDDAEVDGAQNAVITASATGLASAQSSVAVTDNDTTPPPANRAPVAREDFYSTGGRVIRVAAPGVLANDSDEPNSTLTAVLQRTPRHGTLSFNANGSFTYVPAATYSGSDTFAYSVSDGSLESAIVTVTLEVGPARDVTPPLVTFAPNTPRVVRALTGVRGSAVDIYAIRGRGVVPSSGLRGVVLRLQRPDGQYFNGRAFQRSPFDLPAAIIGRSFFALTGSLPTESQAPDGRYTWTAITTDNAGNASRATLTVTVDSTPPAVSITAPGARVTALPSISGGAVGASRVEVALRRADGFYWNGRAYQRAPFFAPASLSASTWTLERGLPSGANLPPGSYTIEARATDPAENVGRATRTVLVVSAPAG